MDAAPLQPVSEALAKEGVGGVCGVSPSLLEGLWHECGAANWGLAREEFEHILLDAGMDQNFGLGASLRASSTQKEAFFRGLKIGDLVLARACAAGNEHAWEHFVATFHGPLVRAAIAISGNETVGRDLADALYAELYGMTERDGRRRCPLDSYRGRGSLLGWLRTTLSQRHVDRYRRSYREQPLEDFDAPAPEGPAMASVKEAPMLVQAVEQALRQQGAEEKFLLASYYLDGKTLAQIAGVLRVHEATISRRLRRATDAVRKQILASLQNSGMSRRAAEEALGVDPRDLELHIDLKRLMQSSESQSFPDETASIEFQPIETTTKKAEG